MHLAKSWEFLGKSLAHDSWTKVAKLVTFTAILVSKIFFYSPWQPKRSQLGALTTHLSRMLCIQLHTVETMEKHGHFFHKKVLCKGTHIHVGYFMDSVRSIYPWGVDVSGIAWVSAVRFLIQRQQVPKIIQHSIQSTKLSPEWDLTIIHYQTNFSFIK